MSIEALKEKLLSNAVINKAFKFINLNRIFVKLAAVCLVGIISILVSAASVGITFGFNVKYSGKVIATVNNASVLENAKTLAIKTVNGKNADKVISSPKLSITLTIADKLDNADKVATAILDNTAEVISGSALIIDGETVGIGSDNLVELVEKRRTAFYIEGAENEASFVKSVEVKDGYYLKSEIKDTSSVEDAVNNLEVKTVSTVVSDVKVAFSTKKTLTSSQKTGYYKVTTAGKNGLNRKTEQICSVNGAETERKVLSNEVITAPVTQEVTVGTAPVKLTPAQNASVTAAGFICPLPKGRFKVSSYYGDGRNHKGVDLCANRGVPIYAAASGTVTYAGWRNDYGYNIIIDHGNGLQTRYAHASVLYVSKGTKVSQGDVIAAVGSTGNSTGNHLHFEVIVNGTRVNPAPYINLK